MWHRKWETATYTTMTWWSSCWANDSTQHRECRLPALVFMPDRAAIMRMQMHSMMPSLNYAGCYPQSPPELRQELIAEQFVRGQSNPELKKYLWVVIRTQKERKLQTLIEVCTDFSSLVSPSHLHRPAEQTFAVHQQADSYTEEVEDQEDVFAVGDCPPCNRRSPDTSVPPSLQQMFALARHMGYEMRRVWPYAKSLPETGLFLAV